MTRKDYVLIADALRECIGRMEDSCAEKPGAIHAAYTLADALGRDNPRFDRARFLEACGVSDGS